MALYGDEDVQAVLSKHGGQALADKGLADELRSRHGCRLIGRLWSIGDSSSSGIDASSSLSFLLLFVGWTQRLTAV